MINGKPFAAMTLPKASHLSFDCFLTHFKKNV